MAFNKKNKRHITVDGQLFYYSVTGEDGGIDVVVMTEVEGSGKLFCSFHYHQDRTPLDDDWNTISLTNQFVVTPYIVRQSIEYGIQQGSRTTEKGPNMPLGFLDEKIDLRLERNRENNFRKTP